MLRAPLSALALAGIWMVVGVVPAHAASTAIVPGKSIGGISVGMTRAQALKRLGKAVRPGSKKYGLRGSQIVFVPANVPKQGPKLELGFGICGAMLTPAKRKICRKQHPDADPNRVRIVQTFSGHYTWHGLGVGSSADDVIKALGAKALCEREPDIAPSIAPWDQCQTFGPTIHGHTDWKFTGERDKETVLVVAVGYPV
jgi:hypothetical protein